jgi:hypothetical protein
VTARDYFGGRDAALEAIDRIVNTNNVTLKGQPRSH